MPSPGKFMSVVLTNSKDSVGLITSNNFAVFAQSIVAPCPSITILRVISIGTQLASVILSYR